MTSQWLSTVKQHVTMATADLQTKMEKLKTSAETTKVGEESNSDSYGKRFLVSGSIHNVTLTTM